MESFFSRYKNPLVLLLVLLVQFVLLAVQVRPRLPGAAAADQTGVNALRVGVTSVVAPPEKVLHTSGLSIRGIWTKYLDLVDVKQQNEALQAENQRLQMEQAALAEDARQGERLQELLAFKQHYIDNTVPAQVVGSGGSDHGRVLYIDKGSDDGIAAEMPVITPDGIVGRIREVMPHTSQVLEISDPTSAAGVLLEETRTRGILRGDNVGHPEIVNMMPDDRIHPGQLVLTSGGDQIFPRGLPVGVVSKIVPDTDNQPLVDVVLKPSANLSRLEEVLVVTGTASTPSVHLRHDLSRSESTAAALKQAATAKAAAAAEAALEAQRASDVLAARLPSATNVTDPDAPDASPGASPATADSDAAPLHPPSALHSDHYTPGAVPAADSLTPGARLGPYAQGVLPTARVNKTDENGDPVAAPPSPSISPAFRAAHDAAEAARPHPAPSATAALKPVAPPSSSPAAANPGSASVNAPLPAGAPAGSMYVMKPLVKRTPILNADGTPMLNADGTPSIKRTPVLNPDGTPAMHRVLVTPPGTTFSPSSRPAAAIPAAATAHHAPAPTTGVVYGANGAAVPVHRTPAVATPAPTSPRTANPSPARVAGATTPTSARSSGAPGTGATAARTTPTTPAHPAPRTSVPTQIVTDGPVATPARPQPRNQSQTHPQTHPQTRTQPRTPGTTTPGTTSGTPPQHRAPVIVPDDGSRPYHAPAQPATPPQGQH